MTIEELLAKGYTQAQAEEILGFNAGLVTKNQELLGKITKSKDDKTSTASEMTRLLAIEESQKEANLLAEKNYGDALKLKSDGFDAKTGELSTALEVANSQLHGLLVTNTLDAELDSVGINPALKAGNKALLSLGMTIKDGVAVNADGKTIKEIVAAWAETDAGKASILADKNVGAGGKGSKGKGAEETGKTFKEMGSTEKTKLLRENPEEFNRLKEAG